MITIKISAKPLYDIDTQGYIIPREHNFDSTHDKLIQSLKTFFPPLEEVLSQRGFTGAAGATCALAINHNNRPVYLIFVGLGSSKKSHEDKIEQYRRALGQAQRAAEGLKITELALDMPDSHWFNITNYTLAKETIITLTMASYHFDEFITDESRKLPENYTVTLVAPELLHDEIKIGIEHGTRIGFAVNQARYWCDLPPVVLTPTALANHAARVAKAHNLKITIFTEDEIIKQGMGGIEAVAKGSDQEARMVVIEYTTDHPNAPTIGLVGKGITFDSGGLSIKPAAGMETMKDDMAGAAAVISTMEALAHLKPQVNIIAVAPITENLISGHATKPGDIIRFYNGKTAEVKNTDAEGRLILADALSYAVKHYKLDAIINIATLTGSCAYALGPFFAGLMSQHPDLAHKLLESSRRSGDRLWELPFHDDYKIAVRSDVADLCNQGSNKYRAGAITAGFFLQNFVGDVPWAHLDVAGTSFDVPDRSYFRHGATGFGVRLFIDLVMNWNA
ncbi:MAG: leucyl aminopeptidase [Candidatus Babeliaceae bacterium]|jgi:leucyl aminopeptidase